MRHGPFILDVEMHSFGFLKLSLGVSRRVFNICCYNIVCLHAMLCTHHFEQSAIAAYIYEKTTVP